MKKMKIKYMRLCCFHFLCLMLMVGGSGVVFANGDGRYTPDTENVTRIGRYSTVENQASIEQINPLMAVAQFRFQPDVMTVGDAIDQVLQNTSYQLVPDQVLPALARETLAKSLPITVRTLGPIRIKEAVLVLIGKEVFDLVVDPAHRLINFKIKPSLVHAYSLRSSS